MGSDGEVSSSIPLDGCSEKAQGGVAVEHTPVEHAPGALGCVLYGAGLRLGSTIQVTPALGALC